MHLIPWMFRIAFISAGLLFLTLGAFLMLKKKLPKFRPFDTQEPLTGMRLTFPGGLRILGALWIFIGMLSIFFGLMSLL